MITILGSSGYVGSNLLAQFNANKIEVYAPKRGENIKINNLGHIIYCIGMTADFRTKPFETVESHVTVLSEVLKAGNFESLTYLSSTRLYLKSKTQNTHLSESDDIVINSEDTFDLFAASKIVGELLALNSGRDNIKIVRLSNVFGADLLSQNFLTTVIKAALTTNRVELFTTPDSSKDYISINDVCAALIKLACLPKTGVYNLAYGKNTSNQEILEEVSRLTGAEIVYSDKAEKIIFKEIDNKKLEQEINLKPSENVIQSLPDIIGVFKASLTVYS